MLQSLEKGSGTEIDFINGAVVAAGARYGVATPVNETLVAAIKGIERGLDTSDPSLNSVLAVRSTTRIDTPDCRIRSRGSAARYHWIFSPLKLLMPGRMPLIRTSVPTSGRSDGRCVMR